MYIKSKTILIFLISYLLLVSCASNDDEGISGTGFNIIGIAEKGPFVKNSEVTVRPLSAVGEIYGDSIKTITTDDLGNFQLNLSVEGPILISINGNHYNEISGEVSENKLLLNAVYAISAEEQQVASVNVLTHVVRQRITSLMGLGVLVEDAIDQAQQEFVSSMNGVLRGDDLPDFSLLSVYDIHKEYSNGNSYLLAFSSIVNQYSLDRSMENETDAESEILLLLNALSEDLEDDGDIDNQVILDDLNVAKQRLSPSEIEQNLKSYSFEVTGEELDVPTLSAVLVIVTSILLNKTESVP